jgi:hypothetical protein
MEGGDDKQKYSFFVSSKDAPLESENTYEVNEAPMGQEEVGTPLIARKKATISPLKAS